MGMALSVLPNSFFVVAHLRQRRIPAFRPHFQNSRQIIRAGIIADIQCGHLACPVPIAESCVVFSEVAQDPGFGLRIVDPFRRLAGLLDRSARRPWQDPRSLPRPRRGRPRPRLWTQDSRSLPPSGGLARSISTAALAGSPIFAAATASLPKALAL
jgi:hypothetical protein